MFSHQERRIAAALSGAPAKLKRVHRWFPDGTIAPEPSLRLEQHPAPQLIYALWGRLRVRLPKGIRELGPGRAVVMAPGVWHRLLEPTAEAIGLLVGVRGRSLAVTGVARDARVTASAPDDGVLDELLADDDRRGRLGSLADLVVRLLDGAATRAEEVPSPVTAMIAVGETNLHLGVTARDLVVASGLGPAQAYRLFRRQLGTTPRAWLEHRRLALATSLLAAGYRVGDVARQCGFATRVQFSRAWSRRHGSPPRDHRTRRG